MNNISVLVLFGLFILSWKHELVEVISFDLAYIILTMTQVS